MPLAIFIFAVVGVLLVAGAVKVENDSIWPGLFVFIVGIAMTVVALIAAVGMTVSTWS